MTREEHLAWAKQQALEYLDAGDMKNAITSMISDLKKHTELANHVGITIGVQFAMIGAFQDRRAVRRWIEGFN
jgi:hypothetical protein